MRDRLIAGLLVASCSSPASPARAPDLATSLPVVAETALVVDVDPATPPTRLGAAVEPATSGGFGFGRSSGRIGAAVPDPDLPARARTLIGRVDDADAQAGPLLAATADAQATRLLDALLTARAARIAVAHQGRTRALRRGFAGDPGGDRPDDWVEVRLDGGSIAVEAVPGPPIAVTTGDRAALAAAYQQARRRLWADDRRDVDLLVGPATTVQQLVDALVALDGAGAEVIGLGRVPADLGARGEAGPLIVIGPIAAMGDLDKADVRRAVRAAKPALRACVTEATRGDLTVAFRVGRDGRLHDATARGLGSTLGACAADVIGGLIVPAPRDGGEAQVEVTLRVRR